MIDINVRIWICNNIIVHLYYIIMYYNIFYDIYKYFIQYLIFIMIIVNIINSLHFLLFKNNTRCFIFHSLESYNLFMNKTEEII
ncbi:hypothetical protein PFUGPA_03439 [Plasmodium falciparum Palo Alto/Uganda]|uniref:Uncharacterized protein n=1 Tax=Plasmodium falciparum (isolate Palo Alto / Uganda) TaxID=57270 RepID=W4IZL8_PLAFP|nr:hypothetical protein PFUGPA_03439 [Plasmodium falciparum Palo Alto/Uganda]